jgi:solute carrier family 25 2-oxodicarboxylate transporter 21
MGCISIMLTNPSYSFGRLYRGLLPPLMLEAPKRAVKFSANGSVLTQALFLVDKTGAPQVLGHHLQGVVRGGQDDTVFIDLDWMLGWRDRSHCSGPFRVRPPRITAIPTLSQCNARLVKIRLQDKASIYTGPADVLKRILAAEGPLGLYNGLESTMWRQAIHPRLP